MIKGEVLHPMVKNLTDFWGRKLQASHTKMGQLTDIALEFIRREYTSTECMQGKYNRYCNLSNTEHYLINTTLLYILALRAMLTHVVIQFSSQILFKSSQAAS